jgi:hypothetical protein
VRTETASYATERAKRWTQPRYFLRFTQPSVYGSGTEFPFSVDFSTASDIMTPTKPKLPWLLRMKGNTQTVEAELGRSSLGGFQLAILDKSGQVLKYFSNPPLTLNGAHDNVTTTILTNEDTTGYPDIGTVEILSAGVRERVRYTGKTLRSFTGGTRGVDGTSAAAHSSGDGVSNGEQIRRGTRVQLFCGYATLAEDQFMSDWKMEVVGRALGQDKVTQLITVADVQRSPRRSTIFLTASQTAPTSLCGNPIDLALAVLLSSGGFSAESGSVTKTAGSAAFVGSGTTFTSYTVGDVLRFADGEMARVSTVADDTHFTAAQNAILSGSALAFRKGGTNGKYDVLDRVDGLTIPSSLIDIATWEALRTSDFASDQYQFSIVSNQNGKAFLEQQFMQTMNCYPVVNQTGQLSIKRYRVAVGSPTVTLDQDVITGYAWMPADAQVINDVQFNYDWNITGAAGIFGTFQEYLHGTDADFTKSIGKYGKSTPLQVNAMGWRSALGAQTMADARAKQVTDRFSEPQNILVLDCFYSKHNLEVGDQVYVNDSRLPNIRTGVRGITNEVFEVLDRTSAYGGDGKMTFTLLWVAAIPSVGTPTSQGTVADANAQVSDPNLDRTVGLEAGSFAFYHKGVFTGSSPRTSYHEATQEFAYVQTSGDKLEYQVYADGVDPTATVAGFDLAAIERGTETAQAVSASSITFATAAGNTLDQYKNMWVEIVSNGTAAANGQTRQITGYSTGRVATVATWGTTPTGTVTYRVIRRGSEDFGNDQNGISGKPSATIGARSLGQWYGRSIVLPSAWNGKTLIGAATAMDTPSASATQALLFRNPAIRDASGLLTLQLTRYTSLTQGIWKYGADANVTATIRQELASGSNPTPNMSTLAVGRASEVSSAGGNTTSTAETTIATLSNFAYIQTLDDVLPLWWILYLIVQTGAGAGNNTGTFRIRADSIAGAILGTISLTAIDGSTSKSSFGPNRMDFTWVSFVLHKPSAVGYKTLLLTAQNSNAAGAGEVCTMSGKLMGWAKSA